MYSDGSGGITEMKIFYNVSALHTLNTDMRYKQRQAEDTYARCLTFELINYQQQRAVDSRKQL